MIWQDIYSFNLIKSFYEFCRLKNVSFDKNYNVLGNEDSSFFSKNEAVANHEEDLDVLKTGKSIIKREGFIPGSRKKKWGFISKFPLLDSFGKIAGVVGTFIDITAQKKLDQKTRQTEIREMLESTFSTSTEILWLISYKPVREYLYISKSIEKMLGYPVEKFYNDKNFWLENCVHPDYFTLQQNVVKTGNCPEKMEYKLINSKKETVWVEEFTFKKTYMGKECIGFITRDISERKKNEKQWKEQGKLEMAENLKKNGMDSEIISKSSGLTLKQINSL
jgi:PAS domain-containing protein